MATGSDPNSAEKGIRTPGDNVHPLSRRAPWTGLGYLRSPATPRRGLDRFLIPRAQSAVALHVPYTWVRVGRCVAYIDVIDEDAAEGDLFRVYDEIQRSRGRVSNVLRIQSLHPKALKLHLDLYMELCYGKGPLSRQERELAAVVTSVVNECGYCITHHAEALGKYLKDEALVQAIQKSPLEAGLTGRDAAVAEYAYALTKAPGAGRKEAVEGLRAAGMTDEEVLHLSEIVAYFNFVNRLVQGLGVQLEETDDRDYNY